MHEFHDCSDILRSLYQFHDHELSDAEADEIRAHLLACEPCLDQFQVEEAMRILIRRCCSAEKAPEQLRMRVRATYTHTVVITDTTD
ncbi:MAG: mycothiol system anti-sigma-R factor [Actinobacteria bacterium HGW-Actinobacteria-5]|jgi:anti-sigma factor (TIGR02949 family)|nr:MAG: mycothiol system anti-sigma-R factor [Actinobacteria bacterium HGW-Actinobacteria-5]